MSNSMRNRTEQWWERVPRILGGWGFAILVFLRFPFPEAQLVDGTTVRIDPGVISWGIYVGLITFSIGIAHSTVMGIVIGSIGRVYSFVRRGGKDRRNSTAGTRVQEAVDIPIKNRRKR